MSTKLERKLYQLRVKVTDKCLVKQRRKQINNDDFTIIANNCWGGFVYQRYGLPYLTPTVGLYFFADDFIKLAFNLEDYMTKPLEFIPYTESKYKAEFERRMHTHIPIARLGDIEVAFLHYKTQEEAAQKWKRRVARINYNNLIFKFGKQYNCTADHLLAFDSLACQKKICFVPPEEVSLIKCGIAVKSFAGKSWCDDVREYARYINLTNVINSKFVCGSQMSDEIKVD